MNIFVDTGAFYALADKRDQHHVEAKEFYAASFNTHRFHTSNYVLIESWLLIRNKLGRPAAMSFWRGIRKGAVKVIHAEPADLEHAWQICQRYTDQDFSIVDAVSFALMERTGIITAFAFDADFWAWFRIPKS